MIACRFHFLFLLFSIISYVPAHFFAPYFQETENFIMSALRALGTVGRARIATMNASRRNMSALPRDAAMYARVGLKIGTFE